MSDKLASKFFASASTHRDDPDLFVVCYGIPGEPTRWMMNGQYLQTFASKSEAELAAYKLIIAKLNRASNVQEFVVRDKATTLPKVYVKPEGKQLSDETKKVFGGFRK